MWMSVANCSAKDAQANCTERCLWMHSLCVASRDRKVTQGLIQEAEALGYSALMVTVDAPYLGKREADVKNRSVQLFYAMESGLDMQAFQYLPWSIHCLINQYVPCCYHTVQGWKFFVAFKQVSLATYWELHNWDKFWDAVVVWIATLWVLMATVFQSMNSVALFLSICSFQFHRLVAITFQKYYMLAVCETVEFPRMFTLKLLPAPSDANRVPVKVESSDAFSCCINQ